MLYRANRKASELHSLTILSRDASFLAMTHIIYIVYTFPFNENQILNNLSANTLQLIINQLAGLVIFTFFLSVSIKTVLANQSCACANAGHIQYPVVRYRSDRRQKSSAGEQPKIILSLYLSHVLITGLAFYGLLFAGRWLFPSIDSYTIIY